MLNQMASSSGEPKMYSATYVENYLDSVENLPNDVQRYLSRIREIDLQSKVHLRDVDYYYDQWSNCSTNELESTTNVPSKRARAMARIQQNLIAAQELGDEKLQVVTQLQEMIDQKTRQLDADFKNLEYADKDDPALMDTSPKDMHPSSPSSYVPSSTIQRSDEGSGTSTSMNNEHNGGNSNAGAIANSTGSNNADRNSKRSRRARDNASRSGTNSNNFSSMSKTSQIDLASDSNNSNSNQSNKNAGTSGQQSNAGGSSNSNRKQGSNNGGGNNNNKKRKRKSARSQNGGNGGNNSNNLGSTSQANARLHDETPPLEETIDPDEPTYCLCDQISFGEMILCDNDLCPIEWFHFSCVSLTTKPKGKWFCPNCRGDRPSVMKPKQQFLKELERYNREKEEKT
ncbi:inhibitor of growth protein 2 [Contarinia nasturtii]|uniref:inhibitor of growth protein 2 n=1 Tax=Contarinia nasturtii TaxID=265458 RepID=UPI0012D42D95|nr:inhibitor of growth protein 2 [Contarinia nasturtii]